MDHRIFPLAPLTTRTGVGVGRNVMLCPLAIRVLPVLHTFTPIDGLDSTGQERRGIELMVTRKLSSHSAKLAKACPSAHDGYLVYSIVILVYVYGVYT